MKSLSRQEDIQGTRKAMEQAQSWFIGIPDNKTPWYLLGLDYADGYVHWYNVGGQARRIVCAGGLEGKGFATEECPICAYVLELYQEAKRCIEAGDEARGKQLKDYANKLHAKPEVQFKAIRGQRTLLKTKTGKEWIADWDMVDEDSTAAVGIISLSESQFDGLTGMIKGESTPFVESGDDLGNRVLWTAKEKRKGKSQTYSAVVWDADEEETDMPEIEIDQELLDIDLTDNFKIDLEEIEKVFSLISGQELEDSGDDEEVAYESDSEEEPDNADLDDLDEDDVDPDVEYEDDGDAEPGDEGYGEPEFEDDLPYEEEEPPKKVVKTAKKSSVPPPSKSRPPVKKSTGNPVVKSTGKTRPVGKPAGKPKSGRAKI